jgi:hypothetical protein
MKKLIILLFISIGGNAISAQIRVLTDENGEKITEIRNRIIGSKSSNNSYVLRYKGTVLFNQGFEMGSFSPKGGKPIIAAILYNIYADEIIAKVDEKEVILRNVDFSLGEHNFISVKNHFYEIIFENDDLKLLKRNSVYLKPERNGISWASKGGVYEGEFIRSNDYFFQFPDNKVVEFTIKKASVLSALSKENISLAEKVRYDTLKINKVEDVISLLK